ncbi:MAG: carbohydrate-binding protein [Clostridia bacterium]|nr:carbohydrate-binding protein [Clostridia bacterium]
MTKTVQQYSENGVIVSKLPIYAGDDLTITYDGLLAKCGANMIYVHIGYGEEWENKDLIAMEFDGGVFKTTLKSVMAGNLNIAFKDSAENWDNNSSSNYSFEISKKAAKTAKVKDEDAVEKKAAGKKTAAKTKTAAPKKTVTKDENAKTAVVKKTARKTTNKKAETEE